METSFYDEITAFLDQTVNKHGCEMDETSSLEERIEKFHDHVVSREIRDPLRQIEAEIPPQDFLDLGLPAYTIPHIHSPLPTVTLEEVANEKSEQLLNLVKFHYIDKALLSLYAKYKPPVGRHIVLFTWVMPGGLGDFFAQIEALSILRKALPDLSIRLITLVHEDEKYDFHSVESSCHLVPFKDKEAVDFPPATLELLKSASFISQLPTLYPHWKTPSGPIYEFVGEYGFIDSPWCHLATGNRSMGLHGLEKGIMIKEMPECTRQELAYLFPDKRYTNFYFAYLITERGHYLYFKTLLNLLSKRHEAITILLPHVGRVLELIHKNREIFEEAFIKEVQIYSEGTFCSVPFNSSGKVLRIVHTPNLPPKECRKLMVQSEDFVACRGDQSFSEVTSSGKIFFYDPLNHALPFLKDLVSLAEDQLPGHPTTIDYLKLLLEENLPWHDIADRMSHYLAMPETRLGLKKLHQIICTEYSFNPTLTNLTCRALQHYYHPAIADAEREVLEAFYQGDLTFKELMISFAGYLDGELKKC